MRRLGRRFGITKCQNREQSVETPPGPPAYSGKESVESRCPATAFCLPRAMHARTDLLFSAPAYATSVRQQARAGGIQGEAAVIARSPARLSWTASEGLHCLSACGALRECESISFRVASPGHDCSLLGQSRRWACAEATPAVQRPAVTGISDLMSVGFQPLRTGAFDLSKRILVCRSGTSRADQRNDWRACSLRLNQSSGLRYRFSRIDCIENCFPTTARSRAACSETQS